MDRGILLAGNMIVDQIKYIERFPQPTALTTITRQTMSIGGLVCNCIIDLAKLDSALPLKALGIVGDDGVGDYILSEFAKYPNIDASGVSRGGATSYTDVMTEPDGRRTFYQYRGANALLAPEHFDFAKISADILHIGYILLLDKLDAPDTDFPTAMCRVLKSARDAGVLTSIDVVSEESDRFGKLVPPALKYADYCTVNEHEAERTTGVRLLDGDGRAIAENLPKACQKLLDMGVSRWAIIHTPLISCGMSKEGELVSEPSWEIPPGFKKSSVGAGDAFASGILYGAYKGWSLKESIHAAGAVAAFSLSGAGASDAILPLPELIKLMESYQ